MDKARRKLVSAIDGLRAQFTDADPNENAAMAAGVSTAAKIQSLLRERIKPSDCRFSNMSWHGFPDGPKCMAFDPVQKLCAIGSAHGCVRILGQAGVEHLFKHASGEPVLHIQVLINEGALITALGDDTLHMWNFRQKTPEIVHSLRMSKERVSTIYLPFQSKWLLVGTEKGNIYFINLSTFELSTQVIYWNKAVDMGCRLHPGSIKALQCCPTEQSKLLIVFERGHVVLWNILTKLVERFAAATELCPVTAICWNNDGRQFMCGHQNGSLSIWNVKKPRELVHQTTPHSPNSSGGSPSNSEAAPSCKPITQLSWNTNAEGEQLIVFAGGMPLDEGALPSLTVLRAKGSLTVLEMDHAIVSMVPLNSSPYASVAQHPPAIAVLLKNDLLVVDIQAQGYPCIEVPHPMDLHESPITVLRYCSDCPMELVSALTLIGRSQRRQGVRLSDKQWPFTGGVGRECATGHQEILLTGHEDGSIKFWQASSEQLQVMYKLKTGRHFEKSFSSHCSAARNAAAVSSRRRSSTAADDRLKRNPALAPSHAVANVELCPESHLLLVSSRSGQITLFRFSKTECCQEIAVVTLPQLCRSTATVPSPPSCPPSPSRDADQSTNQKKRLKQQSGSSSDAQQSNSSRAELKRQGAASEPQQQQQKLPSRNSSRSTDTTSMGSQLAEMVPLKVRGGALRRPAGYQPELVCQIPWINGSRPERVTAMALNSAYGLAAIGTAVGLSLVDICNGTQIYTWHNSELVDRAPIPVWNSLASQDVVTGPDSPSCADHQFSTQTPPFTGLPPKSPGPLSRGNTTDSTGDGEKGGGVGRFLLGSRLQRPQLLKASTFNAATDDDETAASDEQLQEIESTSNCNGGQKAEPKAANTAASSSFVHSPSCSSTESIDKIGQKKKGKCDPPEKYISALTFINCYTKKGVLKCEPCLWLGTSTGAVLALQLQLPAARTSSVVAAPSDSVIRLMRGSTSNEENNLILCMAFMDRDLRLLAAPSENPNNKNKNATVNFNENDKNCDDSPFTNSQHFNAEYPPSGLVPPNKVLTKTVQSPVLSSTPTISSNAQTETTINTQTTSINVTISEEEFSQLALFVSSSEIRTFALPSYLQLYQRQFSGQSNDEQLPLLRASTTHISGQPVLAALNTAGSLVVLSLPSLHMLLHCTLLANPPDDRICNLFSLSEHGCGMCMVSPSEVQKFTFSTEIANQVLECMGELFVPCDMPEPPRAQSFLRGVVNSLVAVAGGSNGSDQLAEIDTFLSEKPTPAAVSTSTIAASQIRNVARPLPTPHQQQLSGIDASASKTITAGQAAREAMQNFAERGERLGAVADATEQLRNNAMNIQSRSAKLLEKYEKKKWYQF